MDRSIKIVRTSLYEHKHKHKDSKYLCDESNIPENVKERTSEEFGRKPTALEEKIINKTKEYIMTLPDGCKVYFVDIKSVRDISYGDFVEGGNDEAYPNFIPKGEIWIDNAFKNDGDRVYQIILHEAIERKLMQRDPHRKYFKETYKPRKEKDFKKMGAHEEANEIEKLLRNNKITFNEAINYYYK